MNVGSFLTAGKKRLEGKRPGVPALLRQLLAHRLGLPISHLVAFPTRPVPPETELRLERDLDLLEAGMPSAYLFGFVPFLDHDFLVDERVLIPRSETEDLVHQIIESYRTEAAPLRILDLCCGSGVIGLSLALSFPEAEVWLTDIDRDALEVAKANTAKHQLSERATLLRGDLWVPLAGEKPFDLVVANPPYVAKGDPVEDSVRRYEPGRALMSGVDGLDHARQIAVRLDEFLHPGGRAFVELGHNHQGSFGDWLRSEGVLAGQWQWLADPFQVKRFWAYRRSRAS